MHRRRDVWILVSPVIVYLIAFSLFPLLYSLAISFFDWDQQRQAFDFIGLGNYQELIADPVFWQATGNTAILVVAGSASRSCSARHWRSSSTCTCGAAGSFAGS